VIFAAGLIDFERLLPLALFGTFAALAWWALDMMAAGKPRALERLAELKEPRKRRNLAADSAFKKQDTVTRMLERASPALAKPLTPKTEAELGKLKAKLAHAGFRSEAAGTIFLGLKFAGLVTGLFFGGGLITAIRGVTKAQWFGRSVWRPRCSICPTWSSGSSAANTSRPSFSPCPTPST